MKDCRLISVEVNGEYGIGVDYHCFVTSSWPSSLAQVLLIFIRKGGRDLELIWGKAAIGHVEPKLVSSLPPCLQVFFFFNEGRRSGLRRLTEYKPGLPMSTSERHMGHRPSIWTSRLEERLKEVAWHAVPSRLENKCITFQGPGDEGGDMWISFLLKAATMAKQK